MENSRIIRTHGLTKRFNSFKAVDHVDMDVKKGEVYGLLGPNGAGKSTLIRMLTTLSRPSDGTAKIAGYDIVKQSRRIREIVGIVSEKMIMYDRLTAYENLRLFAKLYNVPRKEMDDRIEDLLKVVNMTRWSDTQIGKFSTGMKQRINVIRALVSMPRVVFMDEPTLGLDPQSTTEIRNLIRKLNDERGLTIVLTTHIMNEADVLCKRIGLIDRGKIAAVGSPSQLKSMITDRGNTVIDLDLVAPPADTHLRLKELDMVKDAYRRENHVRIIAGRDDAFQDILNSASEMGLRMINAGVNKPSLEDVFLHFTGREMVEEVSSKMKDSMSRGPHGGTRRRVR